MTKLINKLILISAAATLIASCNSSSSATSSSQIISSSAATSSLETSSSSEISSSEVTSSTESSSGVSSSSEESTSVAPVEETFSSLKEGLQKLITSKNYTFTYAGTGTSHYIIYTENSIGLIGDRNPNLTNVYIQSSEGVYVLNFNEFMYVGSEILDRGSSLWEGDYYPNFYGVASSYINGLDASLTSVAIKDKTFKINFALALGYTKEEYVNVNSLTVEYVNNKTLKFTLDVSGTNHVYTLSSFGVSSNSVVDKYLAGGGSYFTPDKEMNLIREYMKGNNFTSYLYYIGETPASSGYIGAEYYTEHYFASNLYSSQYYTGAIEFNSAATEEHPALYGCYYYSLQYTEEGIIPQIISTPVYTEPSIEEYYHYPCYLALWDNMQFLFDWEDEEIPGFERKGVGYYTENLTLLNDFAKNFSMNDNFNGQKPVALAIDFEKNFNKAASVITFYYEFTYNGYTYVMPFTFSAFGATKITVLDQIYEAYND